MHIIEIDLDNKGEYINLYNDDKISDDLHNYLFDYRIPFKEEVKVKINFHYLALGSERERVSLMLKKDFRESLEYSKSMIRGLIYQNIFLFFLGVFLFFLSKFFESYNMDFVSEFFLVVAWVAIWEIAESILFRQRKWIGKKKKYIKLLNSEIVFK